MTLLKERKLKIIRSHHLHTKDTGSHQVQVALLTERINQLTSHLQKHPKDEHSKRGLLSMVGKRRKLLNSLRTVNQAVYEEIIERLKLRG